MLGLHRRYKRTSLAAIAIGLCGAISGFFGGKLSGAIALVIFHRDIDGLAAAFGSGLVVLVLMWVFLLLLQVIGVLVKKVG